MNTLVAASIALVESFICHHEAGRCPDVDCPFSALYTDLLAGFEVTHEELRSELDTLLRESVGGSFDTLMADYYEHFHRK